MADFVQYGISKRANTDGLGVPMIRMNNLQPLGWDFSDLKHIELSHSDLEKYRLEKGDILFNRTNSKELVGKCEVFSEDGDWVFASYLIRVRLDTSRVLPEFVSAFLNTDAGRMQIDQVSRQIAGMSNVNAEELKELEIPLPSLADQKSILNDLRQALNERDQLLTEARHRLASIQQIITKEIGVGEKIHGQKVFGITRSELLSSLNPERYAVLPIENQLGGQQSVADAGEIIQKKVFANKKYPGERVAWLRIDDLENEPIGVEKLRYELSEEITGALIEVQEGDLLVARLGPTILNGKAVLAPSAKVPILASPEFHVLRSNKNWNSTFLLWLIKTATYRSIMYGRSRGGTPSRYRLSSDDFASIPLPSISLPKQEEVADACQREVMLSISSRLRANEIWQSARVRFEIQLLGEIPA
ncbi:restriction endonuclease subunit S [Novosphingobium mangrovi (ex Huang et al. 2023)]|uniref:Restriction endonuclease subunit S n=1 Tax=Novosphingobium mangrovi (ex Huang et al. 2023) TaxID=2976432 RepID=A0ABT2I714_9SPHN|nr:restriction endonuclease subunit S [Novosphingobium mangrovi (ex Huang et al. 2023)]MCT2400597.1 restriction endonuclease subunit S [Novosphingobium mangrovi (ex Huang et al. 2023)]